MPVTKPAYGRKPGPFVAPPAPVSKKDEDKAKADAMRKAAAVIRNIIFGA